MLIDTHCHLDEASLAGRLPEILARAEAVGVSRFIVPGVGPECWDAIVAVAARDDRIFIAPGIHPLRADRFSDAALARLERLIPLSVAMGEIGLDYRYDIPRELQQETLRAQLRLAVRLGVPVLIHCCRAFADLLTILREERVSSIGGVMHAFSGSPEVAAECVKLGLFIGVGGPVTFANAVRPVEVVRHIPLECLLLETDAPDLAPVPYRGRVCEPAFLIETAGRIAQIKGVPLAEVAAQTTASAAALFRLS